MTDHNGEHNHPLPPPDDLDVKDIYAVIDALRFTEIDHHDARSKVVHAIRKQIEPLLTELLFALHDTRVMGAGEQWSIPIGLDCGFEGDLIVRVRRLGPDHKAARGEAQ